MSRSRRSTVLATVLVALAVAGPVPSGAEQAKQEWRVTTIAGIGEFGYSGDGGPATEARLGGSPYYSRLAVAADGTLYLADWASRRLRRIGSDGTVGTVPGTAGYGYPRGVAIAGDGTVYLATDTDIRRIGRGGTTAVALPDDSAMLTDIAVDKAGNVYYANHSHRVGDDEKATIVRLDRSGAARTMAEEATAIYALAVDAAGTVYYTTGDARPDSAVVHAVGANGAERVVVTLPEGHLAGAVRIAPDGTPHVADFIQSRLFRFDGTGALTPAGPALAGAIGDFAIGADGTSYVVGGATVRRVDRVDKDEEPPPASRRDGEPGTVHRIAGTGQEPGTTATGLGAPAVAADGTVYVAEPRRNLVHAISRDGKVTRFAGTGDHPDPDYSPQGRTADEVKLAAPYAVAADGHGNVYIETRTAILRVGPDRRVTTVTEVDLTSWPTDRPDLMPQLTVGEETLFFAVSTGALEGVIRSVTDATEPVTVAGSDRAGHVPGRDSEGKPATSATLRRPTAVSVGPDGTTYLIETSSDGAVHAVRAVRPDGVLVTVAGNVDAVSGGSGNFAGDGGPAAKAALNSPRGVAAGPDGGFYIADTYNGRVRKVAADGVITTVAGTGRRAETGDDGPATEAALLDPAGLAVGADGTVYVTSVASTRVRAIAPDGTISTLADLHVPPARIPFADVDQLTAGADGTVFVGTTDGLIAYGPDGSVRRVDELSPQGQLATGPDGSVYQLVPESRRNATGEFLGQLWRRYPDGTVLRVAADQPMNGARDVAVGPDGQVYLATETELFLLGGDRPLLSTQDEPFEQESLHGIRDLAVGPDGTPYLVHENQVFAVRDGKPEVVAGNGEPSSSADEEEDENGGPALEASLSDPTAVVVGRDGVVFVATDDGVRRVSDGVVETIDAGIERPTQLAITPSGDLYAATASQVVAVTQPAEVEFDRNVWVWFAVGAVALIATAGAALWWWRRRLTAVRN